MSNYVIENSIKQDTYTLNILSIENSSIEELYRMMELHSKIGLAIYRKSIELKLMNEQEFINWQDELNAISYVHTEDL